MKILILGSTGMLGHIVYKYLKLTSLTCEITDKRWPTKSFREFIKNFDGDFIINCIGGIPQKTDTFHINYLLPVWLDQNTNCKIIHPGTDCEMDSDEYGISKKKASDWIKEKGKNTKIIKTSIIGPELNSKVSLMEWFLSQEKEVFGFTNCFWNGVTTLTWAEHCLDLIEYWDTYDKENILMSYCISKYELLEYIAQVYNKHIKIKPKAIPVIDKCLIDGIITQDIKTQLQIMKDFSNEFRSYIN